MPCARPGTKAEIEGYIASIGTKLSAPLEGALNAAVAAQTQEPLAFFIEHFARLAKPAHAVRAFKASGAPKAAAAPKTIVVLTGVPGSGKGSQAPRLASALSVPLLSPADMLRTAVNAGTPAGQQARQLMCTGGLVSDELMILIINERTQERDCERGFILRDYPSSVPQAEKLDEMLAATGQKVGSVVALDLPDAAAAERISGRWVHEDSGRSYHATYCRPKSLPEGEAPTEENMLDDETGEELYQPEVTDETLERRLKNHHGQTVAVLTHYSGVVSKVDARPAPNAVWAGIAKVLKV